MVTTHYIEETTTSDVVSYMRNGRLICEQNPKQLILQSGSAHLEDALYELCQKQDALMMMKNNSLATNNDQCLSIEQTNKRNAKTKMKRQSAFSLHSFAVVTRRTWQLIVGSLFNIFIMFLFPSIVLSMIHINFYKLPVVDLAVYNNDSMYENTSVAEQMVHSIGHSVHVVRLWLFNPPIRLTN